MSEETSTTPADNPTNGDGAADATTTTDPQAGTGEQTADKSSDNLDKTSTSTDTNDSADGDKKSADDSKSADAKDGADDGGGKKDDTSASTPKFDDDLDDWIEKTGRPKPENDEQKQVLQDLRNSQREFTRKQQADKDAKSLGDTVKETGKDLKKPGDGNSDEDDPLAKDVKELQARLDREETTRLQSEFYTNEKVTPDEHKLIIDIFKEKVDKQPDDQAKLRAVEVWGHPSALPDLLDLARARMASNSASEIGDKAAQEERERIARESQANSPSRSASSTTTSDKTEDEARLGRFKERFSK